MAFYQSLAYEASAGSGKTFALVIRYISLLYLGAKPNTILTLTFTNKAANEMQERISTVLSELHLPKRQAEREAIAQTLEISEEEIVTRREALHRLYLASELKISTIDKFFGQIVRLFSQHLGIMPDFTVEERRDELSFVLHFLQKIKTEGVYKELVRFSAREEKRLQDIFAFLSSLYAKDAELTPIRAHLKESVAPNEQAIFALVAQLRTLFEDHCPNLSPRAKKSLEADSIEELLSRGWICKESMNYWDYKKCYLPAMDALLHRIRSALAHHLHNRDRYLLAKYFRLFDLYKETLLEENIASNTLTFDDVTNLLFRLMHEKIDRDFLYFRLDAQIDHLLIDEFQDTNVVQFKILEPIIDEIHAGAGSSDFKSFFYVGDIKQSIYRFRGGKKELFHFIQKHYGVTLLQLETNYRSDCNLVRFVNDTFRDAIEDYYDQKCVKPDSGGYILVRTDETILDGIVETLFDLLEKGVSPDDIAILTFTNENAFTIEEALLQKDPTLKITTQTSAKLINQQYVSAVIEALKYLYFKAPLPKTSMLALSGKAWHSDIAFTKLSIHDTPVSLAKRVIETLSLPASDPNLIALLDLLGNYDDIESFLFECEDLTTDAPTRKSEGVKIMTIHKSKGLEFPYVILTDRFKQKNSDKSTLLFHYKEIALQNIFVRTSKRACVDPDYSEAYEQARALETEDERNLLYVGFTRAKHGLCIVRKHEKSVFDPLPLEDSEIGTIAPPQRQDEHPHTPQAPTYRPIKLGRQEQKGSDEEEERGDDIYAINFGNAMHYTLEVMEGFNQEELENAFWAMKNRFEQLLRDGDAERIKKRIENLLADERFLELVEGEISKEQPLFYNEEYRKIDLLIEKKRGFVIIDYKSSAQVRSEHKAQVRNYQKAIETITQKSTEAYLCYIRDDDIDLIRVD